MAFLGLTRLPFPLPAEPDPFEAKAVEIVKGWLRQAWDGRPMIDEHDAPIVQLGTHTCDAMAADIAEALRAAARGQIG